MIAAPVDPAGDPRRRPDPVGEHLAAPRVAVAFGRAGRGASLAGRVLPQRLWRHAELLHRAGRVELALLAGLHVAQLRAVGLEDHRAAGAEPVGLLHLPLDAPAREVEVGTEARLAQLGDERQRAVAPPILGDDEDVDARPPPRPPPPRAGCDRRPPPSRPPAWAGLRAARPDRRSAHRRRPPTGRRAGRTRTRRRCACSSRGRGPGCRRARRRPRPGRAAAAPPRSARRRRRRAARGWSAPRPSRRACPRAWSRRRAAGCRRSARARPRRGRPRGRAGRRSAPRGRRRAPPASRGCRASGSAPGPRARAAARRAG